MNKKSQASMEFLMTYGWVILVALICIVILFSFAYTKYNVFDEDKDFCLAWTGDLCFWDIDFYNITDYDRLEKMACENIRCKDWRPKTHCELEPNDEDCFCEEYEECISISKTFGCVRKGILSEGGNTITAVDGEVAFSNKPPECIKLRAKTECEKENPQYTIDGKCSGEVFKWGGYLNCTTGWVEFCREKRLYDFSCEELKKPLFFGWRYTRIDEGILKEAGGMTIMGISPEEIYDIAIERGCKI